MPPSWSRDPTSPRSWWLDGVLIESDGSESTRPKCFGEEPPLLDGVHDAIRVRDGRCEFAAEHVDRLVDSAVTLGFPSSFDRAGLLLGISQVVQSNPERDQFLRLYVVRSGAECPRAGGAVPPTSARIESIPFTRHAARSMSEGLRLATAPFPRNELSYRCRHKTLDDDEARAARRRARQAGMDDAILRNTAGRIAGASGANFFLVRAGSLVTPSIEEGAFPGIVRGAALRAAREIGISVEERGVLPAEPFETPEVFLTSTTLGLVPVSEIDGTLLPPPARFPSIPKIRMRFRELARERGLFP